MNQTNSSANEYLHDNPESQCYLGYCGVSLYTRRVMLKEHYHKKIMSQIACGPVEYNYMETLAKTCIAPARQNQFIQENMFNNPPIRRMAIAMNSYSALLSFAENPFPYQQFNLRGIRLFSGGQPFVHHDTRNYCRLYVTTMQAMKSRCYSLNSGF